MEWWKILGVVTILGAAGTAARFAVLRLALLMNSDFLPWGTLAVNVIGCFLAGFFAMYLRSRAELSPVLAAAVMVGFCGAFTTFSTLMQETVRLFEEHQLLRGSLNFLLHNTLGAVAVMGGALIGRSF